MTRQTVAVGALIVATYVPLPFCTPAPRATMPSAAAEAEITELWNPAVEVQAADTFNGPWGPEYAPDPAATYQFVKAKTHGVSPGMTVEDPRGVEWSVKQGPEASVEVVLSRILSSIGYHQPPVYFMDAVTVREPDGTVRRAGGGRLRPHVKGVKDEGEWSWQRNPFVGTKPYQGLLVVLVMFESSDLKNSNNSVYDLTKPREGATRWFVVRDIGTALGETGRLDPKRNDPELFARQRFVTGIENGFVRFAYHGWHQELYRDRIDVSDVRWASDLLARLSDAQWSDAFRAAGYTPEIAGQFIGRLKEKIEAGQRLE